MKYSEADRQEFELCALWITRVNGDLEYDNNGAFWIWEHVKGEGPIEECEWIFSKEVWLVEADAWDDAIDYLKQTYPNDTIN